MRCAFLLLMAMLLSACSQQSDICQPWSQWSAFKSTFVTEDGRVVDRGNDDLRTVSEGQAYAMFFALVANDPDSFARLLSWTETHLAKGNLTAHLPAWHWGRSKDGEWRVLDSNAASDADLWIAYSLAEAGRLWGQPRYRALSKLISRRILKEETINIPGLGQTLLPAPIGFQLSDTQWKLNPSYAPIFQLRRLAENDPSPEWADLIASSLKLVRDSATNGFSPDWIVYDAERGFLSDSRDVRGSYDAIRSYMWAGMLSADDPEQSSILKALSGMQAHLQKRPVPPEAVIAGVPNGDGPSGFSAALLPYLHALGESSLLESQRARLQTDPVPEDAYYKQTLSLFAQGWLDGWYRFDAGGKLLPRWSDACG